MKIDRLFSLLRSPEEEFQSAGGGGAGASDVFDNTTTEHYSEESYETPTSETPSVQPGQGAGPSQQPAPSAPPAIPLDQIPALVQAFQQGNRQPEAPKQLTQEEIDAKLKKVRVTPEIAAMFFGEGTTDAQIKGLQMFVDSIVEHANTVNGYALHALHERLNERYSPALQHIEQQKTVAFTSALTEDYPALKGRENVINMVVQHLKQQGFVARDGNHAAQVVAAQVEHLMKQVDPSFTLVTQQQNQPRQQNMPSMPGIPAGAGGQASGGGRPAGGNKPAWQDVFKR